MSRQFGSFLTRVTTGIVAFASAGLLVHSILNGHGGDENSQTRWEEARERGIELIRTDPVTGAEKPVRKIAIDNVLTGSVKPISEVDEKPAAEKPVRNDEPSVLSLIRENSDIAPAVSSGTNRVSVTVKSGDTLFAIARRHGLKLNELARLNGLEEPYVIKIGQTLYVAR